MADEAEKKEHKQVEAVAQGTNAYAFAAIILAGGVSQRMGETNKLLLSFDGQSFLQRAVAAVTNAGVQEVVVVLGHESDKTREQLAGLNVRMVVNPQYEKGQMTSVKCGLESLSGEQQAVIISLSDQPLIGEAHIKQLISEFNNLPVGKDIVVPTYQSQRGNPIVISESVRKSVLEGGRHPGCRQFIDANPELVKWLEVDDAAFITDVDTPEDYLGLQNGSAQDNQPPAVENAKE